MKQTPQRRLQEIVHGINFKGEIPLEKFCEVIVEFTIEGMVGVKYDFVTVLSLGFHGRDFRALNSHNGDIETHKLYFKDGTPSNNIKILGKPLTLQDILRALNDRYYGFNFLSTRTKCEITVVHGSGKPEIVEIDLSKPITSQSEEVNNQLITLLV